MKGVITRWTGLVLVLALAPMACESDGDPTDLQDGEASLSVFLTDAPGNVEAVWVEIGEITLQGDEGVVVLLDEPTELIQLTELVGELQLLVDGAEVPPGTYGQLRLRIEDAILETTEGDVYALGSAEHPDGLPATGTLKCPSCDKSGLKVVLHGLEVTEGESALVLDFDVSQSFGHQAGKSGKWIMRPVIHATHLQDDDEGLSEAGVSLEGQVVLDTDVTIPECPAGTPRDLTVFVPSASAQTLTDGEGVPVIRTGTVEDDGEFKINFLEPDTYTLGHEAIVFGDWALEFTTTVVPAEVPVADEDVEGILYTITGASCNDISAG